MPLTPFRARKIEKIFSTLDVDCDGVIGRADFLRRVQGIAELRGWTRESPEYRRNVAYSLEEWQNLRESADVDEDGTVTFEEYLRFGEIFLLDQEAVRAYARGDVQLLFDAMDTDGDGRITAPEYREFLEVCGIDSSGADRFFTRADIDQDGKISRAEMAYAFERFLVSDDPTETGTFPFGAME